MCTTLNLCTFLAPVLQNVLRTDQNKLERMSVSFPFVLVLYLQASLGAYPLGSPLSGYTWVGYCLSLKY